VIELLQLHLAGLFFLPLLSDDVFDSACFFPLSGLNPLLVFMVTMLFVYDDLNEHRFMFAIAYLVQLA
jgi:hypothetical protein